MVFLFQTTLNRSLNQVSQSKECILVYLITYEGLINFLQDSNESL